MTALPAHMGQLMVLRRLIISDDRLLQLPLSLSSLKVLEELHLEGNRLSNGQRVSAGSHICRCSECPATFLHRFQRASATSRRCASSI